MDHFKKARNCMKYLRFCQAQPEAAMEQPGAVRGTQGQPGAAKSSQGQPGAARSSQEQPGAARSSQEAKNESKNLAL